MSKNLREVLIAPSFFYLTCRSGDVIELINTASNDWWKGSIGEMKGYFPASYVQVRSSA